MKKKSIISLLPLACLLIAITFLVGKTIGAERANTGSAEVEIHDNEADAHGDVMIWTSISRHFLTHI